MSSLSDIIHGVNLSKQIQVEKDYDVMSKKIENILNTDFDIIKERLNYQQTRLIATNLDDSDINSDSGASEQDIEKLLQNIQKYDKMQQNLEREIQEEERAVAPPQVLNQLN